MRVDAEADAGLLDDIHAQVIATSPVDTTLSHPVPVSIDLDRETVNRRQARA